MAMMAGGPVENKWVLNVCMPTVFPADVEPPPQSTPDFERSKYKAAWHEARTIESDGHKTTGTDDATTPSLRRQPEGAKWVLTYKTDKDT